MDFDLKEVFSILDENNEGQIQLRRFVDVASNYYSDAEQLARITKALDPSNTGLINFEQFCQGIDQISSLQGVSLKDVASDLTRFSQENSLVEDLDQRSLNQDGSTTTFNEYDVESDEQNNSRVHSKKSPTEYSKRKSVSPTLDSSVFGDDEEFSGVADSSDLIYPRVATPQRISPISKRNPLLQPVHSSDELQGTVEELQKTVENLSVQKQNTTDRLAKIQSENTHLKSRLTTLEDLFRDLEGQQARSSESVTSHKKKDQTFLEDREILQSRINAIETELKQTQSTNGQMKNDVKQLKNKLEDVDVQLQQSEVRCNYLADDNEKLLEQLRRQREELEAEKVANAQLIDQFTVNSSKHLLGDTFDRTENLIKSSEIRLQDLDAQVRALKLENEKLKQENEDLRERAVFDGYREGRLLMANRDSLSYAAELEVLSKDELMSKLREQFAVNDRLREYIERMLTVIIENNPQLLEITMNTDIPIRMSPSSVSQPLIIHEAISSEKRNSTSSSTPLPPPPSSPPPPTSNVATESNNKYCRLS